jgi:pimeloyl-ACP methyl ester carboxylesterase
METERPRYRAGEMKRNRPACHTPTHASRWGRLWLLAPAVALLAACSGSSSGEASPTPASSPAASSAATSATPAGTAVRATATATGTATPGSNEQEIRFTSASDTLYGTLLLPRTDGAKLPAALIISGSGPTDRDGNSPGAGAFNTNLSFARALGELGVASLRYDKLGTGKTPLAGHNPADVDFGLFVDEAAAALDALRARPEIDPARVMLLGHSEGGLIALALADRLKAGGRPPALVLAAALGMPILETIQRQLGEQVARQEQAGVLSAAMAQTARDEVARAVASIKSTGHVPDGLTTPGLSQLFNHGVEKFLADEERYDPHALAAGLPPALPVLILRGAKDQQVSHEDTQRLLDGFRAGGNPDAAAYEPRNVNHVFKEVPGTPNPAVDYANPSLAFSREAVERIAAFVKMYLQGP